MHTLDVPYCSQHDDVTDKEWQPRSCGVACVKMALDYLKPEHAESVDTLIEEALIMNGYTKHGWSHDALVNILRNRGLHAYREEFRSQQLHPVTRQMQPSAYEPKLVRNGLSKMVNVLAKGKPVIVSVDGGFGTHVGTHLIILTGFTKDDVGIEGFFYNDPDSRGGIKKNVFVELPRFRQYWRKMAIFVV